MNSDALFTRNRVATAAILLAAVVLSLFGWYWLALSPVSVAASPSIVSIPAGTGAAGVGRVLERAGVIRSATAFRLYVAFAGLTRSLQAGSYSVCSCDSTPATARAIASGAALSTDISVTIPEGKNVWEIDALLAAQHLIEPGSFARTFIGREGTLWPDTYRVESSLASTSHVFGDAQLFGDMFSAEYTRQADGVTHDQLIIASMLEKEAKSREDMALVAGIIRERIRRGMPLQIDATVAYGWCLARWMPTSAPKLCDVTQAPIAAQLSVDGPYNTYTRTGLPTGPIANPGANALWAAEHPTASDYLYYLSTRDGSQLIYARTLAEHNRNRATYLGL